MTTLQLLTLGGLGVAVLVCAIIAARKSMAPGEGAYLAAAFGLAFLLYSIVPVVTLGPLGFWVPHTATTWGVQVMLDLVIAITAAFFLLQPRAKAAGVALAPWLVFICLSGSIGLLFTIARVMLAERRVTAG